MKYNAAESNYFAALLNVAIFGGAFRAPPTPRHSSCSRLVAERAIGHSLWRSYLREEQVRYGVHADSLMCAMEVCR